jgi:hypothetical protein
MTMKSLFTFITILSAVALLPYYTHASEENRLANCSAIAGLAEQIMRSRQQGVDIVDMYENVSGMAESSGDDIANLATELITAAYAQPAFQTEEHQERLTREFKSKAMVQCMKS